MDQRLKVFIAVAEKQNFSRAAEELYISQPAVSQYIRSLEETLGTNLLERTNKFVRLNKAGEIVYQHGKEIMNLYDKMTHLVEDLQNVPQGPLAIGASYTYGEYELPTILAELQKKFPQIIPTVTIGNTAKIADLVASHALDIGIIEGPFEHQGLLQEIIAKDHMYLVASVKYPSLKENRHIQMDTLASETWIIRENGSGTREMTDKVFHMFNLSPKKILEFSSTQLIKESVELGLGISVMSESAIRKELKNGSLTIIDIEGLPITRNFSIIKHSLFETKALQSFESLLKTK